MLNSNQFANQALHWMKRVLEMHD